MKPNATKETHAANGKFKQQNRRKSRPGGNKKEFVKKDAAATSGDGVSYRTFDHNDPEWYLPNEQVAKDASALNFNIALGAPSILRSSNGARAAFNMPVPGIMSIYTVPSIGISFSGFNANSAPVNMAATVLFNEVRSANSGARNYDKADLMLYLLAMDSIYTYWSYMVRLYGICNHFNQENRYTGDALLQANGVNPSIRGELANFRSYINQYAVKAMQRYVPDVMYYFRRHSMMYQSVYKDEDVNKCQFYQYVPAFLYQWARDAETEKGILTPSTDIGLRSNTIATGLKNRFSANSLMTYSSLKSIGDQLLNAMVDDEDTATIGGDLLKRFGYERRYNLTSVPDEYAVIPRFDEEMLTQFHNTNFAGNTPVVGSYEGGWTPSRDAFIVSQNASVDTGELIFNPAFKDVAHLTYDKLLDLWTADTTWRTVLPASRGLLYGEEFGTDANNRAVFLRSCGAEIALMATVYVNVNGTFSAYDIFTNQNARANLVTLYSKFNEAPIWYTCNVESGDLDAISGEIANYTILSGSQIDALHSCALMGLFGLRGV